MLIEYIERVRRQPPEVRRRAAAVWTAVLVGGILLLYMLYLFMRPAFTLDSGAVTDELLVAPYETVQP